MLTMDNRRPIAMSSCYSWVRNILTAMLTGLLIIVGAFPSIANDDEAPIVLAHYMPWYFANMDRDQWGWHWTMNHFDPSQIENGRRQIASHYYPLIGPYDSSDSTVIECQLLQMKLAGIDGVILDWYGTKDHFDYAFLHSNCEQVIEQIEALDMQFAICLEDRVIDPLIESGKITRDERGSHVINEINWLIDHWFEKASYVRFDEAPILLSFGQSGLSDDEWTVVFTNLEQPVAYISQHHRRTSAIGAFDWPVPNDGLESIDRFLDRSSDDEISIPVIYPRFVDVYEEANVHDSWGRIEDEDGRTIDESIQKAMSSNQPIIQIATWNDWGEGTQIEPSIEFGYRDLEKIQSTPASIRPTRDVATAGDLRIPIQLREWRLQEKSQASQDAIDELVGELANGNLDEARRLFAELEARFFVAPQSSNAR